MGWIVGCWAGGGLGPFFFRSRRRRPQAAAARPQQQCRRGGASRTLFERGVRDQCLGENKYDNSQFPGLFMYMK